MISPAEEAHPRILWVDDEPDLVAAMVRGLRKWPYRITAANSGAEALEVLRRDGPFAVIVSDLRMPEMDGVTLLGMAAETAPETVRILFTGAPDLEHAVAAINKGAIFRFITKPCPTAMLALTLKAALDQHRLITAEKVLLQQTLRGSIQALLDVLAVASPMAFGRARRISQSVVALADATGVKDHWQMEVAAMVSQIGSVILPAATLERGYQGQQLSQQEQAMMKRAQEMAPQVLGHIPRLEPVLEVLKYQEKAFDGSGPPLDDVAGAAIPWGARALKILNDLDLLERQGLPEGLAFDTLRGRPGRYDMEMLEAHARIRNHAPHMRVSELPLELLRPGMVLAQDVRSETGMLIVARGQELTHGLRARLDNFFDPTAIIRVITSGYSPSEATGNAA
jgi:response regulator RpfG family c-di-GMP phosphodiesterase